MTTSEYREHFKALLTAQVTYREKVYTAVQIDNIDAYVNRAIQAGLQDFWSAWQWPFKSKTYELSITAQSEYYALPDDFDSMISVREKNSNTGLKVFYKSKSEFDLLVPKETVDSAGNPEMYTVYWDGNNKRISFYPRPTNQTLYLYYNTTPPASVEKVPEIGQACLESFIAKHVYPHGHPGRRDALIEAENEMKKLQVRAHGQKELPPVMFTDTEMPRTVSSFWWTNEN